MMLPVLYKGSVKDVLGPVPVSACDTPSLLFHYTDAYSVFDWGKMPDPIAGKGQSLAILAADLFERMGEGKTWQEFSRTSDALVLRKGVATLSSDALSSAFNEVGEELQRGGLKSHYLGVVEDPEKITPVPLARAKSPVRLVAVRRVKIVRPVESSVFGHTVMDYSAKDSEDRLIPLEVVFRFGCPSGSSLLERAARNPDYIKGLVWQKGPRAPKIEAGVKWEFPLLELFTKLEPSDRPVGLSEALAISGVSPGKLQEVMMRTIWVCGYLKAHFASFGIELADGKLEWGITASGQIMLVDAVGPDELRLLKNGIQLSKEFLRDFYRKTSWYDAVKQAKHEAATRGQLEWKSYVIEPPKNLPSSAMELASQLYQSLTNVLTRRTWFSGAWSLEQVMEKLTSLQSKELRP